MIRHQASWWTARACGPIGSPTPSKNHRSNLGGSSDRPDTTRMLSPLQVERYARDHDARTEEQGPLDQQRALVVQQVLPPAPRYELRQDDRDVVVGMRLLQLLDVLEERLHQRPVGGR